MRVAIDARALTGRFTGDRTYWRGLLSALPQSAPNCEFVLFTRLPLPEEELLQAPNVRHHAVPAPNDRLWSLFALPRAVRAARCTLLHVQYTVPSERLCGCPVVTTVHDISFRIHPEWFPLRHRLLLGLSIASSMKRAARVITDSESSRRDIQRFYALPEEKLKSILLGLPGNFGQGAAYEPARRKVLEKYGLVQPYLLAVGVLQPRKNLVFLAEAFGLAWKRNSLTLHLAIVGKMGWETGEKQLRAAAARYGGEGAAKALVFPGYVADEELPALYSGCTAFAYPSLYEGFGIPPLEAMACRAAVLASNAPAMPEVAGEAACLLDPADREAWAEAIAKTAQEEDFRRHLQSRGPAHAAQFTWEKAAQETFHLYKEAALARTGKTRR